MTNIYDYKYFGMFKIDINKNTNVSTILIYCIGDTAQF